MSLIKILAVMVVAVLVMCLLAIGAGWGVSLFLPVKIAEASIIVLLSGILVGVLVNTAQRGIRYPTDWVEDDAEYVCEECQKKEEAAIKVSRNAPCPCGSGKKYKHCCLNKERSMLKHGKVAAEGR